MKRKREMKNLKTFFGKKVFRLSKKLSLLFVVLTLLFGALCVWAGELTKEELLAHYQYDAGLPLNAAEVPLTDLGMMNQFRVDYDSLNDERIPSLLMLPKVGEPPYPAVIVQHGYSGSKDFAKLFAGLLAVRGYATFAIDAEYHGDRREQGKDIFSTDIESDAQALKQTVLDLRRAVDYLETRDDVDSGRIGYVGVSMGGFLGSLFCGVEERVKTCVLIVAGGDWKLILENSKIAPAIKMRKYVEMEGIDIAALAEKLAYVDPVNLIGFVSPRPLLFLNGKADQYVPPVSTEALFAAAGEPKEIVWYDPIEGDKTGHIPPIDKAQDAMMKWFKKHL
ncbi:MAG: alpha/beta fold hydrolase [bacterium]